MQRQPHIDTHPHTRTNLEGDLHVCLLDHLRVALAHLEDVAHGPATPAAPHAAHGPDEDAHDEKGGEQTGGVGEGRAERDNARNERAMVLFIDC